MNDSLTTRLAQKNLGGRKKARFSKFYNERSRERMDILYLVHLRYCDGMEAR